MKKNSPKLKQLNDLNNVVVEGQYDKRSKRLRDKNQITKPNVNYDQNPMFTYFSQKY